MYFVKSIIDIVIIILLIRLLINPKEAFFNQIYSLIYRISDPILTPSRYITRNHSRMVLITILGLVILRGIVYLSIKPMSLLSGMGISLLSLCRLLFQAYMVIWIINILSQQGYGASLLRMLQRAFIPLYTVSTRLVISKKYFNLFSFLFLLVLYSLISFIIYSLMIPTQSIDASYSILHGLGEGLIIVFGLFPGFFSLVIFIGVMLSWVSPDPNNPIVQAIYGISEPLLIPFRRFIPSLGGLDISPILALICYQVLGRLGQQVVAGMIGMV